MPEAYKTIEYWAPLATELPRLVTETSRSVSRGEPLYYPYWLVPVAMTVKLPFLPARKRTAEVVVDAFSGSVCLGPKGEKVSAGISRDSLFGGLPPFSQMKNEEIILRAAHSVLPAKLRMWGSLVSEIGEARLVFKELRVFKVAFENGAEAALTLDTLSGEYGVIDKNSYKEAR